MPTIQVTLMVLRFPGLSTTMPDSEKDKDDGCSARSAEQLIVSEDKLLDLWTKVKSKIWHFDIQDHQIAFWFKRNYHLEVGLLDFEPPKPPTQFTCEMLTAFIQSIDQYAMY